MSLTASEAATAVQGLAERGLLIGEERSGGGAGTYAHHNPATGEVQADVPVGDAATDIGVAVRFLLGDEARYVTGHTLMVDGGSCPP